MKILVLSSGGVDSTTCLAMAVQEAGAENVLALSSITDKSMTNRSRRPRPWRNTTAWRAWSWTSA